MKPGDLVLCEYEYNDLLRYHLQLQGIQVPEFEQIYTVREVIDTPIGVFIWLEEFHNPSIVDTGFEPAFPVSQFHLLQVPELNINTNHLISNYKPYNQI